MLSALATIFSALFSAIFGRWSKNKDDTAGQKAAQRAAENESTEEGKNEAFTDQLRKADADHVAVINHVDAASSVQDGADDINAAIRADPNRKV